MPVYKRNYAQRSSKNKEIFELETKEEKEAALNAFFGGNGPIGHTMIDSADFSIRRDVIKTIPNTQIVRTSQDLLILLDGEQIADLFFYVRLDDVDIEVRCVDESGKKFDVIWMEYYPTKES